MLAATLLEDLDRAGLDPVIDRDLGDLRVLDVVHDSRRVDADSMFCAVVGERVDGHDFIAAAVQAGATSLLVERPVRCDVAQVRVADVRRAMAVAAAVVHARPSRELDVVAITGTNGKTTTTHMLAGMVEHCGRAVQVIGTLSGLHTTPESPDLQRRLRQAVDAGIRVLALEVSSHALVQHRVDAVEFAVAAFSNLSPEHLDYHGDMQSYFEAKAVLFDGRARNELVNVDDSWGLRLAEARPHATRVSADSLTVRAADMAGTTVVWRGRDLFVPLPGAMNVANAAMAAEAALVLGLTEGEVVAGLSELEPVPGRMQTVRIQSPHAPVVVVDYSHTPDSIARALATIRGSVGSQVAVTIVFGCGGDRDRTKRPLMGAAAESGADRVVITSDNPRSEDPHAIITAARAGMTRPETAIVEADRRAAIAAAIEASRPGDVILVAGKGHERTQTLADRVIDFDDATVALELLQERFA